MSSTQISCQSTLARCWQHEADIQTVTKARRRHTISSGFPETMIRSSSSSLPVHRMRTSHSGLSGIHGSIVTAKASGAPLIEGFCSCTSTLEGASTRSSVTSSIAYKHTVKSHADTTNCQVTCKYNKCWDSTSHWPDNKTGWLHAVLSVTTQHHWATPSHSLTP